MSVEGGCVCVGGRGGGEHALCFVLVVLASCDKCRVSIRNCSSESHPKPFFFKVFMSFVITIFGGIGVSV